MPQDAIEIDKKAASSQFSRENHTMNAIISHVVTCPTNEGKGIAVEGIGESGTPMQGPRN